MPHAKTQARPSGRFDSCDDVCDAGVSDMVDYLKNFAIKLVFLPILAVLGTILLVAFLLLPQFRLIRSK
jgi:hypothetical protein